MHIEFSSDGNIEGREMLATQTKETVEKTLSRFSARITRVEVHVSDLNGHKSGHDDKHCMIETRLEGREPTAVTHRAATLEKAIDGAAGKMKKSIQSTLEREDRR
ncbi:MAG: HPF/RaiA family ribosome-associated protein [Gammaproteobacteria bacterium]|nr:HPF/RaiA family ribosome-associated protein [Gammaproteobacteria bacterium]